MVLKSRKHVFWEALLLTVVVFFLGLLIGISFESGRIDDINEFYSRSEVSLMDLFALNDLSDLEGANCEDLVRANVDFANRVYEEAYLMEKYSDSSRVSGGIKLAHQRYDLLRTFLWINAEKTSKKCPGSFSTVVYLYEYNPDDLVKRATQDVWSKVLFDLKQAEGDGILLIPLAVNTDLSSLQTFIAKYNIENFPVVVVGGEVIISELSTAEDVQKHLH